MWKVLIVDDDKRVCDGIEKIITKASLNFTVVGKAYNGLEGYDLTLEKEPDLIITDIYMPKSNGIEMIQALREQNIQTAVIILSGYSEFKHARDALKLNIRDYLSKPASRQTLLKSLSDVDEHLTASDTESKHLKAFEKQLKTYTKNMTEDLLQNTVKRLVNDNNLTTSQERIIHNWNQHYYLPIRFSFSLDYKAWSNYSNMMIHFGIDNIINELAQTHAFKFFYVILDASNFVLLLEFDHAENLSSASVSTVLDLTTETLSQFFNAEFHYELGEPTNKWDETIKNIQDLLVNFEFSLDSEKISEVKKDLSDAIRKMNIDMIEEVVVQFFTNIKRNNYIYSKGFNVSLELFTLFKYELEKINIDVYDFLDENDTLLHTFLSFNSWNELQVFFINLIESIKNEPVFEDNIKHTRLVQEVIEYVDANIQNRFTLNEIADDLYISRNYLGKIFKEKMNMTFNEYVTKIRIEKARKKLLTGDYMIYEVAESVGFDNPAYFTAVFKRITGYSPSKLLQDNDS